MPRKPELLFISCVGHHLLTAVIANRRISRPLIFLLPVTFHLHLTVEFLTIVRLSSVLKCVLILEKSNPRLHFFKVLLKMTLNTLFYIVLEINFTRFKRSLFIVHCFDQQLSLFYAKRKALHDIIHECKRPSAGTTFG